MLPACIVSTTFPAIPAPPSLILAAFATRGYVKDGPTLVYVTQEAHTVTLTGGDGQYWLALGQDTFATVSTWNRTAGTHYLWKQSATRPPDVDGMLTFIQMTVAGGAITVVTPLTNVTSLPMSKQNSNDVVITGGVVSTTGDLTSGNDLLVNRYGAFGAAINANYRLLLSTAGKGSLYCTGPVGINAEPTAASEHLIVGGKGVFTGTLTSGPLAIGGAQLLGVSLTAYYDKSSTSGMIIRPQVSDAGGGSAVVFQNVAGTAVGTISTSGAATSYNTTSDGRLKEGVETLHGALDVVRALRPVSFRWRRDGSPGRGFLADEVQTLAPEAVTGVQDAVDEAGDIVAQGMDLSKLVPYLTAALQETLAQVEALTARVQMLEAVGA